MKKVLKKFQLKRASVLSLVLLMVVWIPLMLKIVHADTGTIFTELHKQLADTSGGGGDFGPITSNPGTPITSDPGTPITSNPGTPITSNPGTPITSNPGTPITSNPSTGLVSPYKNSNLSLCGFIKLIINIVVGLGIMLSVLFFLYSGFLFVKARGNQSELTKAKQALWTTVLGTAILLGAGLLANIIASTLANFTNIPGGIC